MSKHLQATHTKRRVIKCAVYCRKSTDETLDNGFSSLDAQREACELYIESQRHEGWTCLADSYDDGGYSGANMDRPGLRRLMAEVEMGKIDCVVVYKVDRLSRSLLDFARIMERLDGRGVAFVAITQALPIRRFNHIMPAFSSRPAIVN